MAFAEAPARSSYWRRSTDSWRKRNIATKHSTTPTSTMVVPRRSLVGRTGRLWLGVGRIRSPDDEKVLSVVLKSGCLDIHEPRDTLVVCETKLTCLQFGRNRLAVQAPPGPPGGNAADVAEIRCAAEQRPRLH